MSEGTKEPGAMTFGNFSVDFWTQELRREGLPVRLPAQSFQILQMLLRRPGELVRRQELQRALWPDEAFGDFEHGLNAAVNRLREALGDSAEAPHYVETLPRRGYRFIADVSVPVDSAMVDQRLPRLQSSSSAPRADRSPKSPEKTGGRVIRRTQIALLAGLCAVLALFFSMRQRQGIRTAELDRAKDSAESSPAVSVAPLTALPGMAYAPTFSPDSSHVAFAWDGGRTEQTSPYDLYAKVVGSERLEQLTHKPAAWIVPAWSPDGRSIAFARDGAGLSGIFMISALGGPERKLADAQFEYDLPISLSWSPDGRTLLFATRDGMQSLSLVNGEVHSLFAPSSCATTFTPTFSPDGNWIAFSCYLDLNYDLYVSSVHGGPAKKVARVEDIPQPLAWSSDNDGIFYTLNGQLFEVSKGGGRQQRMAFAHDAFQPAVAFHGDRLAYVQWTKNVNLWRMNLGQVNEGSPSPMALTSREQRAPDISPDGTRVVFESLRSGSREVWVSRLDGGDAVQLTNFHSETGTPRWSPNGKWIVFDSRISGRASLYVVDPQAGIPRYIDTGELPAQVPQWSRDGKWIYFHAGLIGQGGIYKVAMQGGAPQLVSSTPGLNAQEARNGKTLYFMTGIADAEIHARDLESGVERQIDGMPKVHTPTDWVVASTGIYFLNVATKPASIDFLDFGLARVIRRMPLPKPPEYWGGLALSRDESWLAYSQVDRNDSDLMLAEHFR